MSAIFKGPQKAPREDKTPVEEPEDDDERRRRARDIATRGRRSTILTQGGPQEAVVNRSTLLGG